MYEIIRHNLDSWLPLLVTCTLLAPLFAVSPSDEPQNPSVEVTWLGHAFMKFVSPTGKVVLLDPWRENPKFPAGSSLDKVDYILVTHGHFDHLGETISIARSTGAKVICIFEIGNYLQSQGLPAEQVLSMNKGGTITADGIAFTMVNALHSSGISRTESEIISGGSPAGFVVRFENGFTLYDTGDSDVFGDMSLIAKRFHPDLLILPIGGHYTMGPQGAAEACRLVNAPFVLGNHYGTFPVLTRTPAELREALADRPEIKVIELQPGETWRP